jgi:hypothetical protein
MRTKTIKIYSFDELSDSAKENAIENYRNKNHDIFWADETLDSLKGLFETCSGVSLKDYSLGECNSWIRVSFANNECEELSGKRAMAWIENNLLSNIRYENGIDNIKNRVWKSEYVKSCNRKDGAFINRAGEIKDCPFTGYCADDAFLDSLIKDIKEGCDLKTAFEGLASEYQKIINNEIEYQNSDEYISEHLEANNYEFDKEGERI